MATFRCLKEEKKLSTWQIQTILGDESMVRKLHGVAFLHTKRDNPWLSHREYTHSAINQHTNSSARRNATQVHQKSMSYMTMAILIVFYSLGDRVTGRPLGHNHQTDIILEQNAPDHNCATGWKSREHWRALLEGLSPACHWIWAAKCLNPFIGSETSGKNV